MASSSSMQDKQHLKLVIKSANQKYDDFVVDNIDLNWTIKRLKQFLNDNYPKNPETDSIRLIYSGKLLHDHLTLNEILRHNSEVKSHIIHLVHSNNNSSAKPNSLLTANNRSNNNTISSSLNDDNEIDLDNELTPNSSSLSSGSESDGSSSSSSPNASPIPPAAAAGASTSMHNNTNTDNHHYTSLNQNDLNNIFQFHPTNETILLTPKHKYTRIHENYVRYYESVGVPVRTNSWYSSYVQHMALYNYMYSNYIQSLNQTNTNDQQTQQEHDQEVLPDAQVPISPEVVQPQPEPAAAAAPQPNRPEVAPALAAAAAPAERDDDWLSLLHNVASFLVLFSIIYYYSSIERFLVIFTIVLILILYHNGWLSLQRRHVRPVNNNNNDRRREGDQQQPEAANENGNEQQDQQQVNQTASPGILRLAVTFVLTFFTSLIPERPRAAAAN